MFREPQPAFGEAPMSHAARVMAANAFESLFERDILDNLAIPL